jgi:MFS family permease
VFLPAFPARQPVRAAVAASIDRMIEWYDFYISATTAALAFGELYLPSHDPLISPIGSLGFFAHPLHGPIVGHLGDSISRKIAAMMMRVVTVCIGMLQDIAKVGVLAPTLFGLLRIARGVAAGGTCAALCYWPVRMAPEESSAPTSRIASSVNGRRLPCSIRASGEFRS